MKTIKKLQGTIAILITLVILQSCVFENSEKISGNGNVVKQNREVSSFNSVNASGVFNIHLAQGDAESLVIETDENLMSYLETKVEDSTLYIDVKKHINIRHARKKNVYVTFKKIDRLKITTVGNVETDGMLHFNELNLEHSGVGNMKLELDCNKLIADIHSVGDVTLKGKVVDAEIKNSSVGNTNASELIVDKLQINNNSVGNVEVHAEKEISIHSSGVGNLTFSGNAVVKELSSSGIGKVSKK